MSPWLFNVYMDTMMKGVRMGMGRKGVRFMEHGREWRLLGLLYGDDLVLWGESEEDLRAMWNGLLRCVKGESVQVRES